MSQEIFAGLLALNKWQTDVTAQDGRKAAKTMSGGFYDYAYVRVEDFASHPSLAKTTERRAFAALLSDVAEAMHDVEWVDSDAYHPGDENAAIERCLSKEILLEQVIADAKQAADALVAAVNTVATHGRDEIAYCRHHHEGCVYRCLQCPAPSTPPPTTRDEETPCTTPATNATAVNAA